MSDVRYLTYNIALREAMNERLAFSWLSTGAVCQHWSAAYAAMGYWGRI